jgi:hypothetical protein
VIHIVPVLSTAAIARILRDPAGHPAYELRALDDTATAFEVVKPEVLSVVGGNPHAPRRAHPGDGPP